MNDLDGNERQRKTVSDEKKALVEAVCCVYIYPPHCVGQDVARLRCLCSVAYKVFGVVYIVCIVFHAMLLRQPKSPIFRLAADGSVRLSGVLLI